MTASPLTVKIRFEDGTIWATVEEMPGVFATGDTIGELQESLREAIALYLAPEGQDPPHVELHELQLVDTSARVELVAA
jgi:predicted RNase H-like HicB family nuclease